jgi:hypothetical protein
MSVKKLLPPQAVRGILLGMQGLVQSYVTLAISKDFEGGVSELCQTADRIIVLCSSVVFSVFKIG